MSHPPLTWATFPREVMLGECGVVAEADRFPGQCCRCYWEPGHSLAQATDSQTGGSSCTHFCPCGARPPGDSAIPSSLCLTRLFHPACTHSLIPVIHTPSVVTALRFEPRQPGTHPTYILSTFCQPAGPGPGDRVGMGPNTISPDTPRTLGVQASGSGQEPRDWEEGRLPEEAGI